MNELLSVETKEQVAQLKQWIYNQPMLPDYIEENIVIRFLHSCEYDMDDAKKAAEAFFTIRSTMPELLRDRDPLSAPIKEISKIINLALYNVPGNRKLWFWKINDFCLENYEFLLDEKLFFLLSDAYLIEDMQLEDETYVIMDVKNITWRFIPKLNLSLARKIFSYQQEGMPVKLRGVHMVNASSVLNKVFGLIKPLIHKSTADMIHFHTENSTTLFKYFKEDELPADLGGTKPSIKELMVDVVEMIHRNRERLMDDSLWVKTTRKHC